jgi:head-tail adaptor
MIIGKLDRKLKLYTQTYSTNAYGERVVSDNSYVTIYADFDFKGGNTNFDADALINDERIECLIRYRTNIGVSPQYFISNGSTNYSIKSIKQVGRKDAMVLLLEKNDVVDLSQTAPNQFVFTIDTENTSSGSSLNTQFMMPLVSSGSYNATVNWGDGSSDTITSYNQAEVTHTYSSAGQYEISIEGTLQGWQFNASGDRLKMLDVKQWGVLDLSTYAAFRGCTNLDASATDAPTVSSSSFSNMFRGCTNFNGAIGNWDISTVTNTNRCFLDCSTFNKSLDNWNVSNITDMTYLFANCTSYDQDLNSWDTSNCENMFGLFFEATQFNGDIYSWDTSNVENMSFMLYNCDLFDQSLAAWNIGNVSNFTNFMQNASGLSTSNYDATLIAWQSGGHDNDISINFGGSQFTESAYAARFSLIEDDGWTIVDGGIFDPTPADYISILTTRVVAAGGVVENTTASQQFLQDLNDIS